ncbi:hypothetical protein WMF39_05005 [Sorangium sp. So ce1504]|uniref:hypothetical protein n=1 Tax=Sorangium sp. So ce1504 TaxID=3133337 RepID=UPI003F5DD9FB
MRTPLLFAFLASLVALSGAGACGGAVVVDGLPGSSDGAGGAGAAQSSPSASSGGPSIEEQRASCDFFCSLFDGVTCPELRCRARCADLLSEQRPCNALTAPFFDCVGETVASADRIPCEFLAPSITSLFDCLSGRVRECTTDFLPPTCDAQFEKLRACQRDQGR